MPRGISRRDALKQLGVAGAGFVFAGAFRGRSGPILVAGQPVDIAVWSLSPVTLRIAVRPLQTFSYGHEGTSGIPATGELVEEEPGTLLRRGVESADLTRLRAGDLIVRFTDDPPTIHVETLDGKPVQRFTLDAKEVGLSFLLPTGPLLGFGEGGAQFDRKGAIDSMRSGQGAKAEGPRAFQLSTHGTRVPAQWLIGTDGWAIFIHQPTGAFDLTGTEGKVTPQPEAGLPVDLFVVGSHDPRVIMREYARITGLPELPARWTFGYMQSHRNLGGPDEIMGVARKFREKKLPCDALIYLGTDFIPSGWNTHNGEFTWNTANFPQPQQMLDELHREHFRVNLHVVIEGQRLVGTVHDDPCADPLPPGRTPDGHWPRVREVACYWPSHKPLSDMGVDGWWPDQGDGYDVPSRLNRHRMYWEGMQMYRPNERPFALHRNAAPGIQRYGGFIWSGDTRGTWKTLETHVAVAINSGLSGFPYWGSDIGGFNPTDEYTGELHARWFQFGAFCPSFRTHGRNWYLRVPWGWGESDGGPLGATKWRANPAELHNLAIEPVIRRYLELRYRMMPYVYTVAREAHETGLPMMRALWLHHPDDPAAVRRGDEFLWGRDVLVAPVFEKGATERRLYLPRGAWFDFWTEKKLEGGREVVRKVDLDTMPLYIRAGAVLPMGPLKQYTDEPVDGPLTLTVYPGANGSSFLYDDDGVSFDHRDGAFMRLAMDWSDADRRLDLHLAPGSRMVPAASRDIEVRLAGSKAVRRIRFDGQPVQVRL